MREAHSRGDQATVQQWGERWLAELDSTNPVNDDEIARADAARLLENPSPCQTSGEVVHSAPVRSDPPQTLVDAAALASACKDESNTATVFEGRIQKGGWQQLGSTVIRNGRPALNSLAANVSRGATCSVAAWFGNWNMA